VTELANPTPTRTKNRGIRKPNPNPKSLDSNVPDSRNRKEMAAPARKAPRMTSVSSKAARTTNIMMSRKLALTPVSFGSSLAKNLDMASGHFQRR
jgi:hypothetical protein